MKQIFIWILDNIVHSFSFHNFHLNRNYKYFVSLITYLLYIQDAKVAVSKSIQLITLNECYLSQYKGYSDNLRHSSLLHLHTATEWHPLHHQILENASVKTCTAQVMGSILAWHKHLHLFNAVGCLSMKQVIDTVADQGCVDGMKENIHFHSYLASRGCDISMVF